MALAALNDSSEDGWRIMVSAWPQVTWLQQGVASVGRELERSRFQKIGGHGVREEALAALDLRQGADGSWEADPGADYAGLDGGDSLRAGFREVQTELSRRSFWRNADTRNRQTHETLTYSRRAK